MNTYDLDHHKYQIKKSSIPILEQKLVHNKKALALKKQELEQLFDKLKKEEKDIRSLTSTSLMNIIAHIKGTYNACYEKEYDEYMSAKLSYDEVVHHISLMEEEYISLSNQIKAAKRELERQETDLIANYAQAKDQHFSIKKEKEQLYSLYSELSEAITATQGVLKLTQQAITIYKRAQGWSTYDTFFKGGLISDLAKYNNLDEAQDIINQIKLSSLQMNKELSDVNLVMNIVVNEFDSCTRFMDVALDNIFTDWSIRNRIEDTLDSLNLYHREIETILCKLQARFSETKRKIDQLCL